MIYKTLLFFLLFPFIFTIHLHAQEEDLDPLSGWLHYGNMEQVLYNHLSAEAYQLLEKRNARVRSLQSPEQWVAYRDEVAETIRRLSGPFPERSPLNARTLGTIERPDFRVEKVVFESSPRFYVTAALFLPKSMEGPAPAVIYASGHTADGFRAGAYQHKIINLVKKGFVVLAFDPLGQGERLQYVDDESAGESTVGGPTHEHSYAGGQTFLSGKSLASYMIWDGVRSVDYLLSRSEVDPDRIGMTGRSGGGTQTAYIAAVDDRIFAAAPENYITSFEYLLKSIGPQDAEQNFYHGIASGLDHPDLLIARAPKPSLLIATTRDFFSIQGARETAGQVAEIYEAFDSRDHFSMVEDDHGHGSTEANREAMYAFFQRYLSQPGSSEDLEVEIFSDGELQVTPTGQVGTSFDDAESVFTLHASEVKDSEEAATAAAAADPVERARSLSGFRNPEIDGEPRFIGRYQRDGYSVESYFIYGEGGYPLPYLLICPDDSSDRMLLYLDPEGKSAAATGGGEIEWLVRQGHCVLSADLPGTGELGSGLTGDSSIGDVSYNLFYAAVQISRSITGLQAGDISRLARVASRHREGGLQELYIYAKKELTPAALHAAAFDGSISGLFLEEPLVSYRSVALEEFYRPGWVYGLVAGALGEYDLPDLGAALAPMHLVYLNVLNAQGERLSLQEADDQLGGVVDTFRRQEATGRLKIRTTERESEKRALIGEWLRASP